MEMLFSAVLGEAITRSINFFIRKCSKLKAQDVEDRLCMILLRAQVILDETMGWQITNQAMLQQLDMLRYAMYQGCYTLDTFKHQSHNEDDAEDQTQPHNSEELEVLPIVGPGKVGKSTLVAHVCKDERVQNHFSEIFFVRSHDLTDDELATFREGCATKHQHRVSDSKKDGRLLVIVELIGDLNQEAWNRFYFVSKQFLPTGSKIIVTSRSEKIVRFGTTRVLTLKYLPQEAYWYFFKALTFGSMDPKLHPKHVHVAMEIAKTLSGSFASANGTACFLRDNFDIQFWCKVLAFLRASIQRHVFRFGGHPSDVLNKNRPACLQRMGEASEDVVIYGGRECSSQEEVPKIRQHDVIFGSVKLKPHGKFEVLVWRSQIPPYYSYVNTCEIRELKTIGAKRKRSMKT
ncbi:unnamed protein product [Urochloa decumbens]|uniref:NB-ARC domain-containing protein n=1 Tax=Urochloa decumbens TaxID=240449 RepID=A0ABC9CH21_9POAL